MSKELKQHVEALYEWAEQEDSKRSVLCILSERDNETEEGYRLGTTQSINGKMGQIIEALTDAMSEDERVADIVTRAFVAYTVKHSRPAAIVEVNVKGKEADNE